MTIATQVNDFLAAEPDPLIKAGRYQIVPAGAEKTKAHTRITNFAKKLEDEFNLTMWKQRMVLLGAAQRSDITIAALANSDNKKELDKLSESAMEAAKANVARETGSALHRLCERVDGGEELELPDGIAADVKAYRECLVTLGATIELIEEVVTVPKLTLAGRFDRTVLIGDTRYIMDIKTGRDLSYSWGSIAVQLALYAAAETIYDPKTKTHRPMAKVDQGRGLVMHLPAGEATCTPLWVNLEAGRAGIALVGQLLEWRKGTKFIASSAIDPSFTARDELRDYVAKRCRYVMDGGYGDELARGWPDEVPTLKTNDEHTESQLDEILDICDVIEGRHQMKFPDFTDPRDRTGKF